MVLRRASNLHWAYRPVHAEATSLTNLLATTRSSPTTSTIAPNADVVRHYGELGGATIHGVMAYVAHKGVAVSVCFQHVIANNRNEAEMTQQCTHIAGRI